MYQRILVPIDGSDTASLGLDEAIGLARLTGGRLRLLHVVDELSFAALIDTYPGLTEQNLDVLRDRGQALLNEAGARAAAKGVQTELKLGNGVGRPVDEVVLADAGRWPADLVVIGTHGRRGIRRFMLGSSAEQIARAAPVPVLLVRAPQTVQAAAHPTVQPPSERNEPAQLNLPSAALRFE